MSVVINAALTVESGSSEGRVLVPFDSRGYPAPMPDADDLTPADPSDLTDALAFALRFQGRKRVHNAGEIMPEIVAKRLVEHLGRAGFVVMKRPPEIGSAALGRDITAAESLLATTAPGSTLRGGVEPSFHETERGAEQPTIQVTDAPPKR